jgi:hypothetical protein
LCGCDGYGEVGGGGYMKFHRLIIGIVILIFLVLPLFWFPKDALDVGGDDTRLYFYAPENFISNLSLYVWNSYNALSYEYTPWHGFPFIFIPYLLKKIGLAVGYRQMILYSFTLTLGFIACYLFIKELLKSWNMDIRQKGLSAITGALIYVFSPIVLIVDWQMRMPEIYGIFVYPFLLYSFVLAVNRRRILYLAIGALLSVTFSVTIYMAVPWFVGFLIGAFIFLIGHFGITENKDLFIKYLLIYIFFCIAVNLSWILILLDTTFFNQTAALSYGKEFALPSVSEFMHNVQFMNVLYTFLMLPSREFYTAFGSIFTKLIPYKYSFLFLVLPFILAFALIKAEKKQRQMLLLTLAPFLLLAFCITVNITDLGGLTFAFLIRRIFGFVMFKNFQSKFSVSFSFFYALAVGVSLAVILQNLKPIFKGLVLSLVAIALFLPAKALLRGELVGASPGAYFHEYLCAEIPESHFAALKIIEKDKSSGRVLIYPMARYLFMTAKCKNQSYYIGMPYVKPLTQKESFEGILSFRNPNYPVLPDIIYNLLDNNDYSNLYKILWLMNVKYIYLYKEVAPESAQMFLFKYSFIDEMKSRLLKTLADNKMGDFGDIQLYLVPYNKEPSHIMAKSYITNVDEIEWLSKVVYTDYMEPKEKPLIASF